MKDGFKVFDSDMHVLEPPDLWERYIDPAFRDRAPRGSAESPMDATARFLTLGFDAGSTRKILWDNCARLYGIADD